MEIKDILAKLKDEIDKGNVQSEEEMNAFIGKMMSKYNNAPREDAEGLSPAQLHQLLSMLFNHGTMITLNPCVPDELAMTSPFLRICMHVLKAITEDKPLKLTATGALPRWLVQEVYQTRVFPEHFIEIGFQPLQKELDWFQLHIARLTCELAGLARKGRGKDKTKWFLTRKGKKLLNKPGEMLDALFSAYYMKLNWACLDNYSSDTAAQLGFGFTLFLLHKYGTGYRDVRFYADKTLTAFPMVTDDFEDSWGQTPVEDFFSCYSYRTFNKCLHPFGLVEIKESGKKFTDSYKEEVCITPLFEAFIRLNIEVPARPTSKIINMDPPIRNLFGDTEPDFTGQPYPDKLSSFSPSFSLSKQIEKAPGRNDPCPCGSGRKYKQCCLQ